MIPIRKSLKIKKTNKEIADAYQWVSFLISCNFGCHPLAMSPVKKVV